MIPLISSNFPNIIIYFNITFYFLIKKVSTIIFWDCSLLFLFLEDSILHVMFYHFHFQKMAQEDNLLLEKLDQLSDLVTYT